MRKKKWRFFLVLRGTRGCHVCIRAKGGMCNNFFFSFKPREKRSSESETLKGGGGRSLEFKTPKERMGEVYVVVLQGSEGGRVGEWVWRGWGWGEGGLRRGEGCGWGWGGNGDGDVGVGMGCMFVYFRCLRHEKSLEGFCRSVLGTLFRKFCEGCPLRGIP